MYRGLPLQRDWDSHVITHLYCPSHRGSGFPLQLVPPVQLLAAYFALEHVHGVLVCNEGYQAKYFWWLLYLGHLIVSDTIVVNTSGLKVY